MTGGTIFVLVLLFLALIFIIKAVVMVPQGHVYTVERFGRYTKSLQPGLSIITPFVDRLGAKMNMKERVWV